MQFRLSFPGRRACDWFLTFVMASISLGAIAQTAPKPRFRLLHGFTQSDGTRPTGTLVLGANGHFYGVTSQGGPDNCGSVFEATRKGEVTILHRFTSNQPDDGCAPEAGLTPASDGKFYGTTNSGGMWNGGTVYSIDVQGHLAIVHSFTADWIDGVTPYAGVTEGADGWLYGVTELGGLSDEWGTIYAVSKTGEYKVVHRFDPATDGTAAPRGSLAKGPDGTLYGVTVGGSASPGSVFALSPSGQLRLLYRFIHPEKAHAPVAGLLLASNGLLYGTTIRGGRQDDGVVFSVSTAGAFDIIGHFDQLRTGMWPDDDAPLIEGPDGMLYGTAYLGGKYFGGKVFSVSMAGGKLVPVHMCDGRTGALDCASPRAGLTIASDGRLYGSSASGGGLGNGSLFSLELR